LKTIGLTGGIACGKSTVAQIFKSLGVPVLDLDQVARTVVEPGKPAFLEIVSCWPEVVVGGAIDRKRLGAKVMGSVEDRKKLEHITHPRIREEAGRWLLEQAGVPLVVVEAALMVETGSYTLYDSLVVVSCDPEVQLQRLMEREGFDRATAEKWLASQLAIEEKERVAREVGGVVIRNDGGREELEGKVREVWESFKEQEQDREQEQNRVRLIPNG
jgi:dephospho-CoA kinase